MTSPILVTAHICYFSGRLLLSVKVLHYIHLLVCIIQYNT